jgi:hypothetical protein
MGEINYQKSPLRTNSGFHILMFLEEPTQQQLTLSLRDALFNIDRAVCEYVETAAVLKFRWEFKRACKFLRLCS